MKMNQKLYMIAEDITPAEVQSFDDRVIEIFFMNDFEGVVEEFANNEQFAVWSSVDGKNYRLFMEKGYYEACGELYDQTINKTWVDFWDTAEGISKKMNHVVLIPLVVLAIVAFVASMFLGEAGNIVAIVGLIVAVVGMFVTSAVVRKKISAAQYESRQSIVKYLGEGRFNKLLDAQADYKDQYYAALYPEDEEDNEDPVEELETENEEPTVKEGPQDTIESVQEEIVEDLSEDKE